MFDVVFLYHFTCLVFILFKFSINKHYHKNKALNIDL